MTTKTVEAKPKERQQQNGQAKKLPDGWRWVKLGDLADWITKGSTPTTYGYEWQSSGILFLRSECVLPEGLGLQGSQYISEEAHKALSRSEIVPGDILIRITGELGKACIFPEGLGVANINQHIARLRIRETDVALPEYVVMVLNAPDTIKGHYSIERGVTHAHLSLGQVKNTVIPLPPLDEQKRIVGILSDRLTIVETARQATAAQLEAAQALPAAYLRQVFDSPEAHTWEKKRLGDITETSSGSTPSRSRDDYYIGDIPWVKTGELKDGVIHDTEEHISELALKETSVKLLPKGTLLIAMYGQGQTRGRTGLLDVPATTNQACFAVQPNEELFDTSYLQFWFRHSYNRLREETEGRGGNQPNLNGNLLKEQVVPLPTVEKQRNIVNELREANEEALKMRQFLQDQLDTINALPASLLCQAFNGEL